VTESSIHYTRICLSGQMTVRFDDGSEITLGPGDVVNVAPRHNGWSVGEEPCVLLDTGIAAYAKPS
jgi:quercetin dioxygenase-like cupin family protein